MRKLFSLFVALIATTSLWAEDFSVDGIYYNYLYRNNVEVIYRGDSYNSYDNEYVGKVIIPSAVTYNGTTYNVTRIGDGAFSGCSSLTSITIPNSVTSIGDGAFRDCSSLTSVTIPNSVTSIGDGAFWGCTSLTSVTIPNSVTSIGWRAFYDCSSLTSVTIPNSVTSIGDYAFYDCSKLTSMTIPNSVTRIGSNAFYNCSSLTSITIPNSVTSIGRRAFEGTALYENPANWENGALHIDDCLIKVGSGFVGHFRIKENTRVIADEAFRNCSSLTSVTIPNSITSIGEWAFNECSSLTSITIPNSVTSIGWCAFSDCSSLTSVTIGNSVTSIGGSAFEDCTSLTSVTIPNSVTRIGDYAFWGCSSLDTLTCLAMAPPALGEDVFDRYDNTTLLVPCEALPDYQTHGLWGQFTTIECISSEETDTEDVAVDNITTNNANIQKIMRDGQLIILRDGVEYNSVGQEL